MLSQIETSFDKLDKFILDYFKTDQSLLSEAKELFTDFISNRDLEKVENIEQLLLLLRRKGVYGVEEFTVFKVLKKIIHDTTFASLVEGHQKLLANAIFEAKNHYAEQRRRTENGSQAIPSPSASSITFGSKRNAIFKVIAEEISPSEFTRLSRLLKIPENEIKEIELKHQKVRTRTMVLLELYERKKTSIKPLLDALLIMGRADVRRKIENI